MNYDTVDLKLSSDYYSTSTLKDLTYSLDSVEEGVHSIYGYWVKGYCNEANVYANTNGLKIDKTSFPRVIKGSNHLPINLTETKLYIESISDALNVPFDKARITKLHFCHDYKTSQTPMLYLSNFETLARGKRWEMDSGVSFNYKDKRVSYYDKVIEMNRKHYKGSDLAEVNLLRAENQFNRRVQKQFRIYDTKASTLWDPNFYNYQVELLTSNYFNVRKKKSEFINIQAPATPKEFYKILEVLGAGIIGEEQLKILIKDWYNQGEISSHTKTRLLSGLSTRYDFRDYKSQDLIFELDEEVKKSSIEYLL